MSRWLRSRTLPLNLAVIEVDVSDCQIRYSGNSANETFTKTERRTLPIWRSDLRHRLRGENYRFAGYQRYFIIAHYREKINSASSLPIPLKQFYLSRGVSGINAHSLRNEDIRRKYQLRSSEGEENDWPNWIPVWMWAGKFFSWLNR